MRVLEREAAGGRFSVIEQRSGCSASSDTKGESMDNLYQAIKGLCKAVINLVVALLDLLAGIFNGIACLFEKLRPRASRQFHEIRENGGLKFSTFRKTSGEEMEDKKVFGKNTGKGLDEEKIQSIRERLTEKVVSRDTYYQTYTKASYNSRERELIVLIAFLSLLSVILLLGMTGISGGIWLALTVVILVAALASCARIHFIRKKEQNDSLIRMILEEEFVEYKSAEQKSEAVEETEISEPESKADVEMKAAVTESERATEAIVDPIPEAEETAKDSEEKTVLETVEEAKPELDSGAEAEQESEIKQETENIE